MAKRYQSQMDARGEWEEFFARVSPKLVGALILMCDDRGLAEECAQEALVRAFERWPQVRSMASPTGWVFHTGFNLARSSFRRTAIERRNRHRLIVLSPLPDSATAIAVRDAVTRLPARQRAVIVARYYLGLDVAETASVLGCREGTVKAHTFKALQHLRNAGLVDDEEDHHAGSL